MENQKSTLRVGMIFISMIFFIFGFVTTFIITLSDPVKEAFDLTYAKAFLVNSAFFITYTVFAIPSGTIVKKIGYKSAIVLGLLLVSLGSFLFFPAINLESYPFFLAAIFVLASGVVMLQTAANPYVAVLGPEETASGRLNLTQALNSIATWIAPLIIVAFILKASIENVGSAKAMQMPFVIIGALVLLIAITIMFIKLPVLSQEGTGNFKTVFRYPRVLLGALAIFCYVGAEVGIGTTISSYIVQPGLGGGISRELAIKFVGMYWAGAMIGRLFGSIALSDIKKQALKMALGGLVLIWAFSVAYITLDFNILHAITFFGFALFNFIAMQLGRGKTNITLSIFATIAAGLAVTTMLTTGTVALWSVVAIGLFNSIMFPNIFALAVSKLDQSEVGLASGIINTLIVGGAVIPPLMGLIGDKVGIQYSFILPMACYLYILFYALVGSKIKPIKA